MFSLSMLFALTGHLKQAWCDVYFKYLPRMCDYFYSRVTLRDRVAMKPKVSVVRSDGHYDGVSKALSLIEDRIKESLKGRRQVLIKPNFVSTRRQLAATHVDAARAVLEELGRRSYLRKITW